MCAGEVRVSPAGLKRLAEIAANACFVECQRTQSDAYEKRDGCGGYLAAERLAATAKDLALSLRFLLAFDSLAKGERDTLALHSDVSDDKNI